LELKMTKLEATELLKKQFKDMTAEEKAKLKKAIQLVSALERPLI